MLVAGIDIGSITTEALLFDKDKGILGYDNPSDGRGFKKNSRSGI